ELDTGATFLKGTGAYTGDEKQVLMCVLKMRSLPKAKDIVASFDLNAFMVVTRATSVFGEGFKAHGEEEL
ncbi:MAG TPA: YitT family protein, partial [Clostridiales bacterium]|nr:YitT family protein [Clostridiales bacterium]